MLKRWRLAALLGLSGLAVVAAAKPDSLSVVGASGGPTNAPMLAAAISKLSAGSITSGIPAKICAVGDSTTYGVGSQGTATTANLSTYAYPTQLVQALNNRGVPAHQDAWMGDQGTAQVLSADGRVTVGSSWTQVAGNEGLGGAQIGAATTTNALVFTPTGNVTTFNIYYETGASAGTFSYQVDSGSVINVNENGIAGFTSVSTAAATSSAHTITLKYVSGGAVLIQGIEAYDNTMPSISVINMGWSASTSTNWNQSNNPWSPALSAPYVTVGCTTVLINLGINDENSAGAVTTAATIANLTALIAAAKGAGADVIVIAPNPIAIGSTVQATQLLYMNAVKQAAATAGVPLISLYDKFFTNVAMGNAGVDYDALHPSRLGYSDIANFIASAIVPPQYGSNPLAAPAAFNPVVNDYGYYAFRSATTTTTGSPDAGITRAGAGVLEVGTGARGNASGSFQAAMYQSTGSHPTLTSGSCSGSTAVGGNTTGSFTAALCTVGTYIISAMPTAANGYACHAYDLTTPADALNETATTATTATLTGSTAASDNIVFTCMGF